jgi:hypothetical protein
MVWLPGQDIQTKQLNMKLNDSFYGLFLLARQIGMQSNLLKPFQQTGSIHVIFPVSLLRLHVSNGHIVPKPVLLLEIDGNEEKRSLRYFKMSTGMLLCAVW